MFSFFKKKTEAPTPVPVPALNPDPLPAVTPPATWAAVDAVPIPGNGVPAGTLARPVPVLPQPPADRLMLPPTPAPAKTWWKAAVSKLSGVGGAAPDEPDAGRPDIAADGAVDAVPPLPSALPITAPAFAAPATATPSVAPTPAPSLPVEPAGRQRWLDKLRNGLRKTGSSIAQVFTGTQIDDALYEELEAALLMADTGVRATEFLLQEIGRAHV